MSIIICLFLLLFNFKLLFNCCQSSSNDLIGCGGFVKSIVNIDYSRVSIKLYTSTGNLKYTSDCAPNNGYYFIPIYNKGDYILVIDGAPGWKFEPKRVSLTIDGSSDLCSQNRDINFDFKGFTITGKILSSGLGSGPKGLKVTLKSVQTNNIVQVTQTLNGGDYIFEEVLSGYYEIFADSEKFNYIEHNNISVSVTNDNINLSSTNHKEVIVISGYAIKGQVKSNGDPIKGVNFALYSMSGTKPNPNMIECNHNQVQNVKQNEKNLIYLCHILSDINGFFSFANVPPGKYKLFAFYRGNNIKFEVKPNFLEVTVEHSSVFLKTLFKVEGFSVTGRILTQKNGKGINGAQVLVTDEKGESYAKKINTSENGIFYLENMKAETYTIQVLVPHIFFEMQSFKLSPSNPHIPDIVAYAFEICGRFKFISNPVELKVTVEKIVGKELISDHLLETEPEVPFCTFLKFGSYRIKPVIPDFLTDELIFTSSFLDVTVIDKPILDLVFNQFAAKVEGFVVPKEKKLLPKDIYVNLIQKKTQKLISSYNLFTSDFKFKFESVLPGEYIVKIIKKNQDWCWENDFQDIKIVDHDIKELKFVQTGFYVQILSSNPIHIEFTNEENIEKIEITQVDKVYKHCLHHSGKYKTKVLSCHRFFPNSGDQTFIIDVNSEMKVIKLHPIEHEITASLIAIFPPNTTDDVWINAVIQSSDESSLKHQKVKLKIEKFYKDKEGNTVNHYQINIFAKPSQTVTLEPKSNYIRFKPNKYIFKMEDKCLQNVVSFKGRAELFIKGKIFPKLNSVKIKVIQKSNQELLFEVTSDDKGQYVAGPLDCCENSSLQNEIEIEAEKEGYTFKKTSKFGDFVSRKLSSVIVKVVTANKKEELALKGVLISLSGGSDSFRKNLITPENGQLSIIGLNPGQYFFRAVLKEYQFEPSSQILKIKQDETIELKVKGTRIAFSCYGSVSSLSEDPEPNVVMEAIGFGGVNSDGINCSQFQEETVSDANGNFRIRDLKPGCNFCVHVKSADVKNTHISRSIPENKVITVEKEDIYGIRLIVLHKLNSMEITGSVLTNPEYWPSLKLKLYSDSGSKPLLLTLPLTSGFFFIPHPFQLDNRWYILKLESSLLSYSYFYESPSIAFQANTSYQHFQFYFEPKAISTPLSFYNDQDHSQTGFSYLFLSALIIIALVYNYNKILSFFQNPAERFPQLFNFVSDSGLNTLYDESMSMKRKLKHRKEQ